MNGKYRRRFFSPEKYGIATGGVENGKSVTIFFSLKIDAIEQRPSLRTVIVRKVYCDPNGILCCAQHKAPFRADNHPEYVWLGFNSRHAQLRLPEPTESDVQAFVNRVTEAGIEIRGKELRGIELPGVVLTQM